MVGRLYHVRLTTGCQERWVPGPVFYGFVGNPPLTGRSDPVAVGAHEVWATRDIRMNNTVIIGVHGLATKPPAKLLAYQWSRCLWENLRHFAPGALDGIDEAAFRQEIFRMVYWANEIPDHLEDDEDWCFLVEQNLEAYLATWRDGPVHVAKGGLAKLGKKLLMGTVDMLARAITIKDRVVESRFDEIKLYRQDQFIAQNVRRLLEAELRAAWAAGKQVILLTHSMGSFVAYDVLWELSHRTPKQSPPPGRVALFVTMGSPLADSTIRDTLLGNRYQRESARHYPTLIDAWHNYSAAGDVVCHDSTLGDDFHAEMQKLGALPSSAYAARDYVNLYNAFKEPAGHVNPHSIYGYLLQPKLGTWLGRLSQ